MTLKIMDSRASAHSLPFYQSPAACGFTSPAADYLQDTLSLDEWLIQHPAATFFVQIQGDSNHGVCY
ncbi:hypothetical protein [Endozoicomonas sp. Mp262]|uniref:hypothetical protein n=1 Tax=Endozoicomonas sp. Mp262 TaxID=2919499 RepID=UPI0021D8A2E5